MPRGRELLRLRGAILGRGANEIEGDASVDDDGDGEVNSSVWVPGREVQVPLLLEEGVRRLVDVSAEASELEHDADEVRLLDDSGGEVRSWSDLF